MRIAWIILFLLVTVGTTYAQDNEYPYPSLSPKGHITQVVGHTTVEIEYERPSVRKRMIFGELVPWGKVWRTGAGSCTKVSFDRDVIVGGQKVAVGKYSMFSIPNPSEWIIILNRDTTLYGSYDYDNQKDVARFVAIPTATSRFYETLNFDIEILPNDARIYLSWADVQVSFAVETTTDSDIERLIVEELLTKEEQDSDIYAGAAEYLYFQGQDLLQAVTLTETAIEIDVDNGWARSLKIKIYERLKLYDRALTAIDDYLQYARSRDWEDEVEEQNTLDFLQREQARISQLMK